MQPVQPVKRVSTTYDVVVIGGGPAGMMAAATAANAQANVLLLEKNTVLGKKLSLTGGGRCNVTNNKPRVRDMLSAYKRDGKFLFSTFTQHGVAETLDWFQSKNVTLIEENEGRLFPHTHSAQTILKTLSEELHTSGVSVQVGEAVQAIVYDTKSQSFTITTKENTYSARACIVATGGTARPDTGATGEGFAWIKGMGHQVFPNSTALVPLALVPDWTKALSGLTLSSVSVSVWAYDKKQMAASGRLLFTHFGVTGPLILNMSAYVGEFLEHTPVTLRLDVFPQYDAGALKAYFKTLLASNKKLVNTLAIVLPRKLVQGVLQELQISGETPCHSVSTQDRKQLRTYLKAIPLPVAGLLGPDKAVISSGGVKLEEIDFKTMQSKIIPGLYLIGDMLHINRPSGGYSLQLCWSTGYVAGSSAAKI